MHHEEQFFEIILNLGQWFRRKYRLKVSYLDIWQPFCLAECNHLCKFGRGYYEEQFNEIIWNLGQWFRSRCCLKYFLSQALVALLFGRAEPFMHILKRASWATFILSFMKFGPVVQEEMSFKDISYLEF